MMCWMCILGWVVGIGVIALIVVAIVRQVRKYSLDDSDIYPEAVWLGDSVLDPGTGSNVYNRAREEDVEEWVVAGG